MSTSPQNQIQALITLQQANCVEIWTKHGLSVSERDEKLEEFKHNLQTTYDNFTQNQIQEAIDLENEIQQTRNEINTQLARLGITMPLPPLTGSLKEQYNTTTEKSLEVHDRVKQREKEVFSLTTSIRKLCNQLNQSLPVCCSCDDNNGPSDLSHQFTLSLQQMENELRANVDKNVALLHDSLPYLIYYLREMNLYSELGWIYQSNIQWEEQGEFIRKHCSMIGPEITEIVSGHYQFTEFDNIIQQRVNMALIPAVKDLREQKPSKMGTNGSGRKNNNRGSLVDVVNLSPNLTNTNLDPEIAYAFSQYNEHIEYAQFPIDVPFIKELQQKVLQLQVMYRERTDFSIQIGDKIRNLWELTETSEEEASAWTESCQDLSMITLRTFQIELIRLCEKKAKLLPQWIANHEQMLVSICEKLGTDQPEIQRKLSFCRSQYTLDDHLESLRVELSQLRAELAIRQPILDKITLFNASCHVVDELKILENHPDRFKDSKIRTRLDRIRKDCKAMPNKAAILYKDILSFESTHGELYNSGQRILHVLEQNEFCEQARKQGLLILPRNNNSSRFPSSMSMSKLAPSPTATTCGTTSKLNTTRAGSSGAVLRQADDGKLNRTRSTVAVGSTLNKSVMQPTKTTVGVSRSVVNSNGVVEKVGAARPVAQPIQRRRSKELTGEALRKARLRE